MHTKSSLSKLWIGRWLLLTQETGPRDFIRKPARHIDSTWHACGYMPNGRASSPRCDQQNWQITRDHVIECIAGCLVPSQLSPLLSTSRYKGAKPSGSTSFQES